MHKRKEWPVSRWGEAAVRSLWRFCLLLCCFSLLAAAGCQAEEEPQEETTYQIYYKNISHTGLYSYSYRPSAQSTQELITELWNRTSLQADTLDRISVVPANLVLQRAVVDNTNLNVYFDSSYSEMDTVSELFLRAAVVKTFTSIPGIESVTFFVDESPLTDASYSPLGAQQAADYVDIIGTGLSSTRKITLILYYANETGDALVRKTQEVVYESSYSIEKDVVSRLIAGPSEEGLYAVLPSELKLISINVKDGICYVNFDDTFVTDALSVEPYIPVYSVVNSLIELPDVQKVQILINGESNITFKGAISFENPLERKLDYLEETES